VSGLVFLEFSLNGSIEGAEGCISVAPLSPAFCKCLFAGPCMPFKLFVPVLLGSVDMLV
jgi:hypothetical protein